MSVMIAAARGHVTYTIDTPTPRDTAMGYAKRLVRLHGVRLSTINFRRGPDGAHLVSAPSHPTLRFSLPSTSLLST